VGKLLVAVLLFALTAAASPEPANYPAGLTAEQLRQDLKVMADTLRRKHPGLDHFTPKERFEQSVRELDARLGALDPDAAFVAFNRITASVGDAHTFVDTRPGAPLMPIALGRFGDEIRVVGAAAGLDRALGARVTAIGGIPIADALARALELAARDENMPLREAWATSFLSRGELLHGLGLAPSGGHVVYALLGNDGRRFDLAVDASPGGAPRSLLSAARATPLARTRPGDPFWCAMQPAARTLYCTLRRYDGLGERAREMLELVRSEKPDKLVIDLRQAATGGDYVVGRHALIEPLRALPAINRKGHLFVLIGPLTFSAAMSNAAQFRSETEATLVGRPIGEKPNSWQEVDRQKLPNSGWTLHHSTRFYEFAKGGENMIRPDVEIASSWEDFVAGRDRALEWVLARP
jgi:hypothetical protein